MTIVAHLYACQGLSARRLAALLRQRSGCRGIYCHAVSALADELAVLDAESSGLLGFRDYLTGYIRSDAFTALASQTQALDDALAAVRYSIHIKGNRVRVNKYEDQAESSASSAGSGSSSGSTSAA